MWNNTPIEIPKDLTESQIELSRKSIAMQTALDIKESNPSNTDSVEELMKQVYDKLSEGNPMPEEFARILHENFLDLF